MKLKILLPIIMLKVFFLAYSQDQHSELDPSSHYQPFGNMGGQTSICIEDGYCDIKQGESCLNCAADCLVCCGDQVCEEGLMENCFTCPLDCGSCNEQCGNGACQEEWGENYTTCIEDCEPPVEQCGNGICESEEYYENSEEQGAAQYISETCATCPEDCGTCCGNGICETEINETIANCPWDCENSGSAYIDLINQAPSLFSATCGDGECEYGESCAICPLDCGKCKFCTSIGVREDLGGVFVNIDLPLNQILPMESLTHELSLGSFFGYGGYYQYTVKPKSKTGRKKNDSFARLGGAIEAKFCFKIPTAYGDSESCAFALYESYWKQTQGTKTCKKNPNNSLQIYQYDGCLSKNEEWSMGVEQKVSFGESPILDFWLFKCSPSLSLKIRGGGQTTEIYGEQKCTQVAKSYIGLEAKLSGDLSCDITLYNHTYSNVYGGISACSGLKHNINQGTDSRVSQDNKTLDEWSKDIWDNLEMPFGMALNAGPLKIGWFAIDPLNVTHFGKSGCKLE